MKYFFLAIATFLLYSCDNITKTSENEVQEPQIKYNFPNKTVITSDESDKCIQDAADEGINFLSALEKNVLDVVAEDIDVEKEKSIGQEYHEELMQEFKLFNDNRLDKLRVIFQKIKPYIERNDLDFNIFLVEHKKDPKMINAFTIPGGNVYFTTALLDFVESDDELAFIMGHEIGHNENKHTHRQLKRQSATKSIFGEGTEDFANVFSLLLLSYGQPDEIEADRCGAYLAYKAGYNPERGFDFFKRLAAKGEEKNYLVKFLSTHPYSEDRVKCGMKYLEDAKIK